jgi:ribose 5-phosphate isomerase B
MRIALGNDHRAVELKNTIIKFIESEGHIALNFGCNSSDSVDYPDFAAMVADAVIKGKAECGILLCSSGIGMSIAANKHRGIRAALCCSPEMATRSRQHNNANVLCLGADMVSAEVALQIVRNFINTDFEGGRHQRRLDKIAGTECDLLDNK